MIKQRAINHGFILPTIVILLLSITITLLALATFTINQFSRTNSNISDVNSLLSAEAGAEQTLYQLNQDNNFSGYGSAQTLFDDSVKGKATYESSVAPGTISNEKIVTATGKVYAPGGTKLRSTRKVKLTVVGTTATTYGVQTGPGGLIMSNSATIANSNVYVNGYLQMSNNARIGSPTNPVNVSVANIRCPTSGGSSYPVLCTSGQPITLTNSAHIYGTVCATGQTSGASMSNPGLQAGCSAPAADLPAHDRTAQVNAVTTTLTSSQASCSNNQTRNFAANTKVNGNLTISNNCQVTVNGNLWVSGEFNISNSAAIRVADGLTARPVVMVDGANGARFNNSSRVLANSSNIGFEFITYRSNAACSPDCANVTGQDLYNSRNTETISLSNSSGGAGSIFYARWTKARMSNGSSAGALIGQTVELNNSGNVSFGSLLSSGTSVWSIKTYQQIFE